MESEGNDTGKTALRRLLRQRRRDWCARYGGESARALVLNALPWFAPSGEGQVVAGYWPLPGEMDPRPLMSALQDRGYVLALPVVKDKDHPLCFHQWAFGDILEDGPCGARQPPGGAHPVIPDHVLVPLLGFDGNGGRLGQGGGYYDRTLADLSQAGVGRVRTLGIAFSCQRVDALPLEEHDRPLDAVATESDLFEFDTTFLKAGEE